MPVPTRPKRLGNYEIVAKIAGGGFSTIYLGRQGDDVAAIKVIRHDLARDTQAVNMFLDEARVLSRLDHPNIVRTLEFGSDQDQHYIATELMLGATLQRLWDASVAKQLPLRYDLAASIAARIADGLAYAHEATDERGQFLGLVHRDVNPSNIFLTFDGGVKLFDFGLAKAEGRRAKSSAGIVKGKLPYLSPEQVMQFQLDRRSDVFTLGTTLWEMTTMRRLFARDSDVETVKAVRMGPIPDPRTVVSGYPDDLAAIVKKALERNREHRYADGAELAADLDAFIARRASAAGGAGTADPSRLLLPLLDMLFPGERQRQNGWLKRSILPPGPTTLNPPPPSRRET